MCLAEKKRNPLQMINEIRINFQRIPSGGLELLHDESAGCSNPYQELTSIISDLNGHPGDYCIVVQVINRSSLSDSSAITKQLKVLLGSLTKRELEVFDLAMSGHTNKLISEKLFITIETVRSHRKSIVNKAGVSRIEEIKDWLLQSTWRTVHF